MAIYIISSEAISCQDSFEQQNGISEVTKHNGGFVPAILPDFKKYIDARLLRRMSKILRMGVATAKSSLDSAQIENLDAIIVGTAYGCLEDTSKFLNLLIDNKEEMLNPTPFIQSTHNTIAGQIALMIGCKSYNLTFTQKDFSFETALTDAVTLLNEDEVSSVLLGGVDEFNEGLYDLLSEANCDLVNKNGFLSEGASFFTLSNKIESDVQLKDFLILSKITSKSEIEDNICNLLKKNDIEAGNVDLVMVENDSVADSLKSIFKENQFLQYGNIVGKYPTASASAMHLGYNFIKNNNREISKKENFKTILIINKTEESGLSCIILQKK